MLSRLVAHLETSIRIWIFGLIKDDARLDMDVLSHIHQVVVFTTMILNQTQVWFLPVTAVPTFREADSLVPVFV